MIAHISIGVGDIDRSKRFYDAALEPLGYKCLRAAKSLLGYGYGRDSIALWVVQAEHPVPADEKSGLHFCFAAPDTAAVDVAYPNRDVSDHGPLPKSAAQANVLPRKIRYSVSVSRSVVPRGAEIQTKAFARSCIVGTIRSG